MSAFQDHERLEPSVPSHLHGRERLKGASLPQVAKRAVDLTGSLFGLILLTPLILAVAILIRLETRGPILFGQWRRGYRGELFRILKFRTMRVDPELRPVALEESNESAEGANFKLRDDPRVTPLGRFLRSYRLDELPKLINVLSGEMSFFRPTSPSASQQR